MLFGLIDGRLFPFDDHRFSSWYGKWTIDELYELYLESLNKMVQSGIYDIVAHFDLMKKFNKRPNDREQYIDLAEKVINSIKKSGMALELNTAGLRKPVREIYPEKFILQIFI